MQKYAKQVFTLSSTLSTDSPTYIFLLYQPFLFKHNSTHKEPVILFHSSLFHSSSFHFSYFTPRKHCSSSIPLPYRFHSPLSTQRHKNRFSSFPLRDIHCAHAGTMNGFLLSLLLIISRSHFSLSFNHFLFLHHGSPTSSLLPYLQRYFYQISIFIVSTTLLHRITISSFALP